MSESVEQARKPVEQRSLNRKNILVGVIIGAILIALGVLIYLLLQPKPEESAPVTTPKTTTISAKKDETASWETYRDSSNMFELKYPPSLYVKGEGGQIFLAKKSATTAEQIDFSDNLVQIRVDNAVSRFDSYYNTPDNTKVNKYGDFKIKNSTVGNYKAVEYGYSEIEKEEEIKANEQALKLGESVAVVYFKKGIIVNKNGTVIEISTNSYFGEFKTFFDQMLTTFRFD